jgi:hypothetical protein
MIKRIIAGAGAVALTAGLSLMAVPAQAAIPADGTTTQLGTDPDGAGPLPAPVVSITQVKTAKDAGGVPHTFKVVWGKKYKDPVGKTRVVLAYTVYRSDALTEAGGEPADAQEDIHHDVSSHGTVRWTQHKYLTVDLDAFADNQVSVNARNPISDANDSFIRINAGVDGDGAKNTAFQYFYQPEGLPGPAATS